MSNCAECGRALPRFALGRAATLCKDCLARHALRPAAMAAPAGIPAPVAVRRMPSTRSLVAAFPVTFLLLGLNVLVFVAMVASGVSFSEPTSQQLIPWGADFGPLTLGGQPWRLLTSTFVHAGILHIGFNMWCFWQLGMMSERVFGRWTYLAIYLLTGISASMLSVFVHPQIVAVGASGAIFGICGGLIPALYFGRLPIPAPALRATLRSLIVFVVGNLAFGAAVAHIDNFAHIGGLVLGLLAGALLSRSLTAPPETRRRVAVWVIVALAALLYVSWGYVRRSAGTRFAQQSSRPAQLRARDKRG